MKLAVPTPPGWRRQKVAGGELLRAPEGACDVLVLAIEGAQLEPVKWLWKALAYGGPTRPAIDWNTPELTEVVQGQLKSITEWTAVTVEARVGDEYRFVAYFTFLDLSATVIARSLHPISAWRDDVIEMLAESGPDFTPERITCLAELLDAPPPLARQPIELPRVWRRTFSGGNVVLVPRMKPDSGWIQQTMQLAPLRSVPELFEELRDAKPELGITEDGEYFAIGSGLRGRTHTTLAFVFGPESYTRIEGRTTSPDDAEMFASAVRAVAYNATFGYGSPRIRPFYYQPPAKWSALVRPGSTLWVSPLCARIYHVLRVFEACPIDKEETIRQRRFESVPPEFLVRRPYGPAVYYREADEREVRVMGYSANLGGAELRILDATVNDAEYCYRLRIECEASLYDVSLTLLEEVVQTIVPLPESMTASAPSGDRTFSQWAE